MKKRIRIHTNEFMRGLDFFDPTTVDPKVVVIGAGGIGSWSVLQLAKLGVRRITVYDDDLVSEHNLSTTPYGRHDIGRKKVFVLKKLIGSVTGFPITAVPKRFTGSGLGKPDILVSAVDSMDARRMLFKTAIDKKVPFFVDGRIGGEKFRVYAIQPGKAKDRKKYRKTLVPNHRITPLPCTGQQIIYMGNFVASHISLAVKKWVMHGTYIPEQIVYLNQTDIQIMAAPPVETRPKLFTDPALETCPSCGLTVQQIAEQGSHMPQCQFGTYTQEESDASSATVC